jgi:hypothetical protein
MVEKCCKFKIAKARRGPEMRETNPQMREIVVTVKLHRVLVPFQEAGGWGWRRVHQHVGVLFLQGRDTTGKATAAADNVASVAQREGQCEWGVTELKELLNIVQS